MTGIRGEITIARPLATVFDYVADQTNEPAYNPRMLRAERISPGPVGLGTRFRSAVGSGERATEMLIEVTGYDRPHLLASRTTMKQADIDYELRFDEVPAGTRMRWSGRVRPHGLLRLLGPLVDRLGARQEQRIWGSLKKRLEAEPPGGDR